MDMLLPIELFKLIVDCEPALYGRISRASSRHHKLLVNYRDHYKMLSLREVKYVCFEYTILPNGNCHGKWLQYYDNGNVYREIDYVDGVQHGKVLQYYRSGELMYSIDFVNNLRHGEWFYYLKSGLLFKKAEYAHGKLIYRHYM
ncbi:membrane-binding protein [Faustovirus]|nr:membrane-binding protein [Faustovirus]